MSATAVPRIAAAESLQALRLWAALFAAAEGWLELRALQPGAAAPARAFYPLGSVAALIGAARWAGARSGRAHVWFGINPRNRRGGGTAADVAAVVAFAVDVDARESLPAEELRCAKQARDAYLWPPGALRAAKLAALAKIQRFPLAATCLVDSGHGWQAYWALKEPWALESDGERRLAAAMSRRLTATIGGDATHDLARVLRVPGTVNCKASRAMCRLVRVMPRARYDPADIEPFLRDLDADPCVIALPRFAEVPAPSLAELPVSRTIKRLIVAGDADHHYPSRSEADMAVVRALVRSGVQPDAIRALFRAHAIGAKYREKGRSGDRYLGLTIAKARSWAET